MNTDNKKRAALLLLLLVSTGFCYSQYTLQKDYIHIRANDTVVKQEVNYKDPGRSGTNVFWNYSNLQPVKFPYCVCYGGNDTVVFVKEHLTEYKYRLNRGDSLMLTGYRNRTTYFNAFVPGLEFRYPFHYMDSLESNFYGEGKYSDKLAFISQGREKVKADAWGTMLLPGNDTLKNVVRMCLQKDICEHISWTDSILLRVHGDSTVLRKARIEEHLRSDTVLLRQTNYRWYAEGYRYPVFETIRCETFKSGSPMAYYATAFYYPPEEHIYLENDSLNKQLQELLKENSLSAGQHTSRPGEDESLPPLQSELLVFYNIYPNPVKTDATLEYYLSDDAQVCISLFDLSGRLLKQTDSGRKPGGAYNETISMDAYSRGSYILRLTVADKTFVEKLIKE